MSRERELLVHALDRLKYINYEDDHLTNNLIQTIEAQLNEIEQLLAQTEPEQEPVAWMYERQAGDFTARTLSVGFEENFDGITTPLYTSPPTREPLSDAEIYEIFSKNEWKKFIELARAIEKAHGIGE